MSGAAYASGAGQIREAVAEVVRKQAGIGIDIVDDGEYSKPSFVTYVRDRLARYHRDRRRALVGLGQVSRRFGVSRFLQASRWSP